MKNKRISLLSKENNFFNYDRSRSTIERNRKGMSYLQKIPYSIESKSKYRNKKIRELIQKAQNGSIEARNEIIERNIGLIIMVAKSSNKLANDFLDSIQEGVIGLITAIQKFNLEYHYKFSTYAVWWIRQAIIRKVVTKESIISIPSHIQNIVGIVLKEMKTRNEKINEEEIRNIIKKKTKANEFTTEIVISLIFNFITIEKDKYLEDNINYSEKIPKAINSIEHLDLKKILNSSLKYLTERERVIIIKRFGLEGEDRTLERVGDEIGLCRERVRQIEKEALAKLRELESIRELKDDYL